MKASTALLSSCGLILTISAMASIGHSLCERLDRIEEQVATGRAPMAYTIEVNHMQPSDGSVVRAMRVTGYVPANVTTALGVTPSIGWTAAVSRDHADMLGRRVYVEGLGLYRIEDVTHRAIENTLDIAVPRPQDAAVVTMAEARVILLPD